MIRQLPDGQLYRASPAEYLISMNGVPNLAAHVDPMGSDVACRSRKVSWRRVPEDIAWALGVAAAESTCVVKCHWSVNGDPAAISTTYVTQQAASKVSESDDPAVGTLADLLFKAPAELDDLREALGFGQPVALHLEMQPPPSSVARGLRLRAGQPAAMVTVRFDDPNGGRPVALTVAALRPDLFRIVIDSPAESAPLRAVATGDAFYDGAVTPDNQPEGSAAATDHVPVSDPEITFLQS